MPLEFFENAQKKAWNTPYFQEDQLSAGLEESEEVKLLARVVSDLNSHPVVILGHDRLTEDEVKLFQRQ